MEKKPPFTNKMKNRFTIIKIIKMMCPNFGFRSGLNVRFTFIYIVLNEFTFLDKENQYSVLTLCFFILSNKCCSMQFFMAAEFSFDYTVHTFNNAFLIPLKEKSSLMNLLFKKIISLEFLLL